MKSISTSSTPTTKRICPVTYIRVPIITCPDPSLHFHSLSWRPSNDHRISLTNNKTSMDYRDESVFDCEMAGNSVEAASITAECGDSVDMAFEPDQDDKMDPDSFEQDTIPEEIPTIPVAVEPYVGQEFDSESAAQAFYNGYAARVGFVIRVSKLSRSRRDGAAIGRSLVCNKEGFRSPDKREKIIRQRAETRIGCRAMILVRKASSGKWVLTKFVKEHNHNLTPGGGRKECIYDQYPNEHDRIRELSHQLAIEKKRSSNYKRQLELLFEEIDEHNESLSKKIKHIVDNVKEMEDEEKEHRSNV
ncbi:hypothetical protein Q3G72_013883 [Acer saccharum]|nr:hypothetical protein Q3G72_013883 [Acer saccharum]